MISQLISRLIILVFGTLYPAYRSYKAIKTKDVREYVKWMMYWTVFAFFTAIENAADLFISWLPLYYEVKIGFLIWLISPATRGSSILYRRFVHPWLTRYEKDIDLYIDKARESSYATLLRVGRQGLSVATDTFLKTAVTGQNTLLNTLRKYNSMQDLHQTDAVDGGRPSRKTWHGDPSLQEPVQDHLQYNFDDDYRILEQHYEHMEPEDYTTLPGGATIERNGSSQDIIPESRDELDPDWIEEPAAEDDDDDDDDYIQPTEMPTAPSAPRKPTSNRGSVATSKRRQPRPSGADVSQMRGYSTLPRSRVAKASATSQPTMGGTLPRSAKRNRSKIQTRSKEA